MLCVSLDEGADARPVDRLAHALRQSRRGGRRALRASPRARCPPRRAARRGRPRAPAARARSSRARCRCASRAGRPARSASESPLRPRPSRRGGSRSRRAARPSRCRPRCTRRVVLPACSSVTRSSRPRPGASPPPSTPCGSRTARPSICNPPQMPSTGTPAAACRAIAPARPVVRSHSRSASVLLLPGITIAAALSISAGVRTQRVWLASGANSSRFAIRGRATIGDAAVAGRALERDAVLLGQGDVEPRDDPERRHAGALLEPGRPGREQRGVAAEAVEQEAGEQRALAVREAVPRAQQVREGAAAVDVAAQQHGRRDIERDGHVDDVAVTQVDLGRAARAFDHDDVEIVEQAVQRAAHDGPEPRAALAPGQPRDARGRPRPARRPASACRPPA